MTDKYRVVLNYRLSPKIKIVWIYSGSLAAALDAATWLQTVKELRRFGWGVTLVAVGPKGYRQISGVEVLCISRPEIYLFRQVVYHLKALHFIARQWATTDIILFHETSAVWIVPLRLIRILTGKRQPALVMDTRSLPMPLTNKRNWKDRARKVAYLAGNHLGNKWSDGRLAITKRMADAAGIPAEKLWGTWASGADIEHFRGACRNRQWPSFDEPVRLIYHGSMHYERNLMLLCQAVAEVNVRGMIFHLSLFGEGTERADLERFASQTQGAIQVHMPVSCATVPNVLAQAHVGVLPFPDETQFRVSSPIKLFEYMAAGLPVLVTRISCHTDVIGLGEYAFWAKDAGKQSFVDALCLLWQSRCLLGKMGAKAAVAATDWTWQSSAENLRKALAKGSGWRTVSE